METPLPPLEFPPAPPFAPPPLLDQTGKVKTITQTTTPIQPRMETQMQGKSSQPLPPPPPFIFPNGADKFNHLTNLWMATPRDQALKELFAEAAKGGISIESGEEAVRFLDYCAKQQGVPPQNIQAVTIGGAIFVRPEYDKNVQVLREEIIHTYQQAAGIGTNELVQGEIDARLQMIVNRHVWGIENNEVREMIDEVRKMRETGKY